MTTITPVQQVAPVQLAVAVAAVYTTPAHTTAKLGRAVFCNTTGGALTITAGITTGGALAPATTLISARTIAAAETYVSPELAGAVIPAGSALHVYASAATSVTFTASGLTIV